MASSMAAGIALVSFISVGGLASAESPCSDSKYDFTPSSSSSSSRMDFPKEDSSFIRALRAVLSVCDLSVCDNAEISSSSNALGRRFFFFFLETTLTSSPSTMIFFFFFFLLETTLTSSPSMITFFFFFLRRLLLPVAVDMSSSVSLDLWDFPVCVDMLSSSLSYFFFFFFFFVFTDLSSWSGSVVVGISSGSTSSSAFAAGALSSLRPENPNLENREPFFGCTTSGAFSSSCCFGLLFCPGKPKVASKEILFLLILFGEKLLCRRVELFCRLLLLELVLVRTLLESSCPPSLSTTINESSSSSSSSPLPRVRNDGNHPPPLLLLVLSWNLEVESSLFPPLLALHFRCHS
mmetsp:Transcript_22331/g.55211  ORF Transcript_22331/g.55211 Transcript_22331/m.55211 type:complete len:350 (+) Transcript_22331:449-1498(+)